MYVFVCMYVCQWSVVCATFSGLRDALLLLCGLQNLEGAHERVVHTHHRT